MRLYPAYPEAHLELALLHRAKGDPGAARSHLDAALEVWRDADPEYPPARTARELASSLTAGPAAAP